MTDPSPDGGFLSLPEARRLAAQRQWPLIVERAADLTREELLRQPELAFHLADALWRVGRVEDALSLAGAVDVRARQTGAHSLQLNTVNVLGISLYALGRIGEAAERFGELLEKATEWGDNEFAARAANNLGVIEYARGHHDQALTFYHLALAAYQRMGYYRGLAGTHHNLGVCYRDLGFSDDADAHFQRTIKIAREDGSDDFVASAEVERAMLFARRGDARPARSLAVRALKRFERLGDRGKRGEVLRVLAAAARAEGDDRAALGHLDEAIDLTDPVTTPLLHAELLRDRGELMWDLGHAPEAQEALHAAAGEFRALGNTREAERIAGLADRGLPTAHDG